ncbi:RNA polymerase factor sigma-54 [Lapidilactobacillus bayanensis]|uniref:RNA polymerase factor sigma-54 n=1 Tax=Lapidilactobacillus bayanensis TaxID=2485998 RepID=UPI000F77230C|nr:RNA polymerase factor sigma-54 [Lapidilactobacillus bayanensis]
MLGQGLVQSQTQRLNLTQSLQQSIQLLQFDVEELDKYLDEAALNNPFLVVHQKTRPLATQVDFFEQLPAPKKYSLVDYVQEQLTMNWHDTRLRKMLWTLSESLTEKGYLIAQPAELLKEYQPTQLEIADCLTLFSQLDPPGLGARNLQESLTLQLARCPDKKIALQLVQHYYDNFICHRWSKIVARTQLSESDIQTAFDQLKTLSPYPAYGFSDSTITYVRPSLIVYEEQGCLKLTLGSGEQDGVGFAQSDYDQYQCAATKEVETYLHMQLADFHFLANSLAHRRRTILRIGQVILQRQTNFFETQGRAQIKPLLLQEVAQQLNVHPSTISRAIRGKYLQTSFGNYALKQFFGRSLPQQQEISTNDVKKVLARLIQEEDAKNPYTDRQLVELLKDKGFVIARRTVAKYREQLGFLKAKQRQRI